MNQPAHKQATMPFATSVAYNADGNLVFTPTAHLLVTNQRRNEEAAIQRAAKEQKNHENIIRGMKREQNQLDLFLSKNGSQVLSFQPSSRYHKKYNGSVVLPTLHSGVRLPVSLKSDEIPRASAKISRELGGFVPADTITEISKHFAGYMRDVIEDVTSKVPAKVKLFGDKEKYINDRIYGYQDVFREKWNERLFDRKILAFIDFSFSRKNSDEVGEVVRVPRLYFANRVDEFDTWQESQARSLAMAKNINF